MAYSDFPNLNTAFPEGVPAELPTTPAEIEAFGERLYQAMLGIRAAMATFGPRGQAAHNAFMLHGIMALGLQSSNAELWWPVYQKLNPLWNQIYEAHLASPYSSTEGMLPPTLPLDPLEIPIVATYWPETGWLTETQAATAPHLQPLPVAATPTTHVAPILRNNGTPPAAAMPSEILGFPIWQIALAAVAVLFFMNSK